MHKMHCLLLNVLFNRMMIDLNYNHLRYFWAVAHDGNLTRTADALNVSQSALSVQIKKLEDRLGHNLFERRGRQLHLTEAGRITLDHADTIFATGHELLGTLRETGAARQAVRIGALATLSRNFQIGFLKPVLKRTDVEVFLQSGSPAELLHSLQSLNLDIVLTNSPPPTDILTPFIAHRLSEQAVSLVGTAKLVGDSRSVPELLAAHPVILPTSGSSVRMGFDAYTDRLEIRPQVAAEVDDVAMMRLLVREGFALAILPPIAVRDELETGLLMEADTLPGITETFYAVTLDRRFPNPLVRSLIAEAKT